MHCSGSALAQSTPPDRQVARTPIIGPRGVHGSRLCIGIGRPVVFGTRIIVLGLRRLIVHRGMPLDAAAEVDAMTATFVITGP